MACSVSRQCIYIMFSVVGQHARVAGGGATSAETGEKKQNSERECVYSRARARAGARDDNFLLSIFRTIKFVYKRSRATAHGLFLGFTPGFFFLSRAKFLQFRLTAQFGLIAGRNTNSVAWWILTQTLRDPAAAVISNANMVSSFISARVARNKDLRRELGRS